MKINPAHSILQANFQHHPTNNDETKPAVQKNTGTADPLDIPINQNRNTPDHNRHAFDVNLATQKESIIAHNAKRPKPPKVPIPDAVMNMTDEEKAKVAAELEEINKEMEQAERDLLNCSWKIMP